MSQPAAPSRSPSSSSADGEKRSLSLASPISTIPAELTKNEQDAQASDEVKIATSPPKDLKFWLVFLSLCVSMFLSALDLTGISTALPDIVASFQSPDYSWVGSAYTLSSTALIPFTAGMAAIFGRRAVMVTAIITFAIGSALSGAAQNMPMLIAARTIQGAGGGAILCISEILVVDLVPIAERGMYFGILGSVWALASAIAPPIGGALATAGQWRWFFYMNLPLCGVALTLVILFLNVKTPQTTLREKFAQIDWFTILFIAASTSAIIGLTWGGSTYSWSSGRVLAPLILGLLGLAVFVYLEKFAKHPTVPFPILTTRTAIAGYITTFLHSVVVLAVLYFLPVYFQAVKDQSAIQSGVSTFSLSFTIAPFAMIAGVSVGITGHYKLQNNIGWALASIGLGLMTLIKYDSNKAVWVGYPVVVGIGIGMLYSATNFPILAPVTPAEQPFASAFYGFTRSFGQVFGIAIGSTILQNRLNKLLPPGFAERFGSGEIAFAAIPVIKTLDEPLKTQVRIAFTDSIKTIWQVMVGVACLGFVVSLAIKSLPLTMERDENWGLEDTRKKSNEEVRA
ncbi:hypothetical protein JCM3765_000766 [Sporobolomyces pararoseus]